MLRQLYLAVALLPMFAVACGGDESRTPAGPTPPTDPVTVEDSGFTLSGTVSDSRSNGPVVAGAKVRVADGRQESATTGSDGRYEIRNVSGTVTVRVDVTHYKSATVEVTMDADRTVDFDIEHTGNPPFGGAVYITPDLLTPSDPTSLQGTTYAGRGDREIYDRRPDTWITVNAYLFNARYGRVELEFQVNPEFGSREAARAEVDTYASVLGRLPAVLLSRAEKVQINAGNERFGGSWENRSFLVHTEYAEEKLREGFLEEVFFHEGGHVSLDGAHKYSADWLAAQEADSVFISTYARNNPRREDVAESILAYFALRYRPDRVSEAALAGILTAIPNRLVYFDEQGFDMSPYQRATASLVPSLGQSGFQPLQIWQPFEGPPTW